MHHAPKHNKEHNTTMLHMSASRPNMPHKHATNVRTWAATTGVCKHYAQDLPIMRKPPPSAVNRKLWHEASHLMGLRMCAKDDSKTRHRPGRAIHVWLRVNGLTHTRLPPGERAGLSGRHRCPRCAREGTNVHVRRPDAPPRWRITGQASPGRSSAARSAARTRLRKDAHNGARVQG